MDSKIYPHLISLSSLTPGGAGFYNGGCQLIIDQPYVVGAIVDGFGVLSQPSVVVPTSASFPAGGLSVLVGSPWLQDPGTVSLRAVGGISAVIVLTSTPFPPVVRAAGLLVISFVNHYNQAGQSAEPVEAGSSIYSMAVGFTDGSVVLFDLAAPITETQYNDLVGPGKPYAPGGTYPGLPLGATKRP